MLGKIKSKFDDFDALLESHYHGTLTQKQKRQVLIDFFKYRLFHRVSRSEYIQYDFFRYSGWARDRFITNERRELVHSAFNTEEGNLIFDKKEEFCRVFDRFLMRDWVDTTTCSFEEFSSFAQKHPRFFGKPMEGCFGKGTGIHELRADTDLQALFAEFRKDGMLLEELITQNQELSEFNPTSVNTLRIVTILRPDGSVTILSAGIRLGRKGRVADNFHHYGIAALIDVETGIVYTQGIDKTSRRYILHPDSKKQIVGYHIPMWDKVVERVTELAKVVPEVHYVGWDIAIGEDEIFVVEGNCKADPDVIQMPDGIGKWPVIKPMIDEALAAKR